MFRAMKYFDTATTKRWFFGRALTVAEWERAVVFRRGALIDTLGPGQHRRFGRGWAYRLVDTRPWVMPVPTQEVPTADGTTIKVTLAAMARVVDPGAYVTGSQEPTALVYLALQLALRTVVGAMSVEDVLAVRGDVSASLLAAVGDLSAVGVVVERVEVKDVILPSELKRAQAEVLVARAQGLAALERARGETAALRSLANAARMAAEQPALLQLRLLQELGASSGHTVVIGAPVLPAVGAAAPTK